MLHLLFISLVANIVNLKEMAGTMFIGKEREVFEKRR